MCGQQNHTEAGKKGELAQNDPKQVYLEDECEDKEQDAKNGARNSIWPSGTNITMALTSEIRLSNSFQCQIWSVLDKPLSSPNACSKYSTWFAMASTI